MIFCCEPLDDLVEFGVDLVGFSHVVGYWHELGGCGILYCLVMDSMYINELWIYNCGDYINALTIYMWLYTLLCSDLFVI